MGRHKEKEKDRRIQQKEKGNSSGIKNVVSDTESEFPVVLRGVEYPANFIFFNWVETLRGLPASPIHVGFVNSISPGLPGQELVMYENGTIGTESIYKFNLKGRKRIGNKNRKVSGKKK